MVCNYKTSHYREKGLLVTDARLHLINIMSDISHQKLWSLNLIEIIVSFKLRIFPVKRLRILFAEAATSGVL